MSKFLSILFLISFALILLPEKAQAAYYSADLKEAINIECKKSVKEKKYSTKTECINSIKSALEAQGIVSIQLVPDKDRQEHILDICVFDIKIGAMKYNECIYKAVNKELGIKTETIEPPVLRKNQEDTGEDEDNEAPPIEVKMPKDLVRDLLDEVQSSTFYVKLSTISDNFQLGSGSAVHIGDGIVFTNCHVVTNYQCKYIEYFIDQGYSEKEVSTALGFQNIEQCYEMHGYEDDLSISLIPVNENAGDPNNSKWLRDVPIIKEDILTDRCILDIGSDNNISFPNLGYYENININDTVYAVGNPRGYVGKPTEGKITMKYNYPPPKMVESAPWLRESGLKYIETDAPIDKGNSGGGLYTKTGELIGITSSCKILGGPEECHILDDGSEYCQPYCNLNSPQNWSIPVESFLDLM